MRGEAASADTVAAEEFVKELQHITGKEVTHINKFSALMRLLFLEKDAFQDFISFEGRNFHPDLRQAETDLLYF
jgi:hypothetical protein